MKVFPLRKRPLAMVLALAWGCLPAFAGEVGDGPATSIQPPAASRPQLDLREVIKAPRTQGMTESDRLAAEAVELIWDNKLKDASEKINRALRMRVDRSYYHLINGLVYHLQARQGENSAYDLAEQGYQQAIRFDANNWQAHMFAGMLSIDTSQFAKARQYLAEALYYHPDDAALLNAFAYAAYRSGKPDLAAGAINALEAQGGPKTTLELRNAAVIMAAVGEGDKAKTYLQRLRAAGDMQQSGLVERRLADWEGFYKQGRLNRVNYPDAPAYADPSAAEQQGAAQAGSSSAPAQPAGQGDNRMVVVDVVLISTEEHFSSSKGLNLLRGLQLQFGGNGVPAFSRTFSGANGKQFAGEDLTYSSSANTTVTRSLTIPGITYSMNIFNSNEQRDQILARPTLVATSGQVSEFFSGVELNAVVVNSSANNSGAPVNIQKEIGVSLAVAPTINPDNSISLKVRAQRTFIRTPNNNLLGFDARVETTKSKVDASVVLRYGETLILGGLSEKEAESTRDGVPLLQDIPLAQYLFSNKVTLDYQKSTLILVTPRPAQYVYQPEKARQEYEQSLSEDERPLANLRARYADWFKPYPNWASVFHHLQENSLYREFRTGDVALESWTDLRTLQDRLGKVLDFLYY